MERYALFATVDNGNGGSLTFRIGLPVPGTNGTRTAWGRFARLWADGAIDYGQRRRPLARARVRYARRWYRVRFMEVRATDRHGQGLGSERHAHAIPVPYRAAQRIA